MIYGKSKQLSETEKINLEFLSSLQNDLEFSDRVFFESLCQSINLLFLQLYLLNFDLKFRVFTEGW